VAKLLLGEVRQTVGELRDHGRINLRQALEVLTRGIARPHIHLVLSGDFDRLDPARAHALFRCAQEAMTNAIKHSGARNLWIDLTRGENGWELGVRDDGLGTAVVAAGNGLRGIRERIEQFSGRLEIESQAGRGFRLRGTVPEVVS
jgi:signal transduction histidine kinase